jgi:hypothetical protein
MKFGHTPFGRGREKGGRREGEGRRREKGGGGRRREFGINVRYTKESSSQKGEGKETGR